MEPKVSVWLREPAKAVGWLVAAVIAVCAGLAAVVNALTDLLPASWQPKVNAVMAVVVIIGVAATRIQALITRNGIGPTGKVFDGVYAPITVAKDPTLPPLDGTTPGGSPQGG